jgi:superfamily I DNA/RNA helicase
MSLSKIQQEIVDSKAAKIIVDAGSGSGKTRVLTERVKRILQEGVNPKSVVVITFTNMAADELYSRLADVPKIKDCFIGTIHAYANKLLKKTGYNFEIFSEYYQTQFMTELIPKYANYCTVDDYMQFVKYERLVTAGKMPKSSIKDKFSSWKVYDELLGLLGRSSTRYFEQTVVSLC